MSYSLEVCAYNIASCRIAEDSGAGRIELCDNPADGGTTPSYGTILQAARTLSIPVFPIIRPRGGGFVYSEDEWMIIQADIAISRELGCSGIATGILLPDGRIDRERMCRIVELAYPMQVTCHRAFDRTPDPYEALEMLVDCGCSRVLTSGQQPTAPQAADLLAELVRQAKDRIIIMPGSGVRAENLELLVWQTGAIEFHSSAKKKQPDAETGGLQAGNDYLADEAELKQMVQILKREQVR